MRGRNGEWIEGMDRFLRFDCCGGMDDFLINEAVCCCGYGSKSVLLACLLAC